MKPLLTSTAIALAAFVGTAAVAQEGQIQAQVQNALKSYPAEIDFGALDHNDYVQLYSAITSSDMQSNRSGAVMETLHSAGAIGKDVQMSEDDMDPEMLQSVAVPMSSARSYVANQLDSMGYGDVDVSSLPQSTVTELYFTLTSSMDASKKTADVDGILGQ